MLSYMYTGDYDDARIPRWASERCKIDQLNSAKPDIEDKQGLLDSPKVETKSLDGAISADEERWNKSVSEADEEGSDIAIRASRLRMEVNTLVYACGDKFGIHRLKAAAAEKFARSITDEYTSKYFEEAIELVFRVTAPGDSEIRSELLLWYIRHREAVSSNLDMTMMVHEPLTWKVYLEMGKALDAQKESFAKQEAMLEARNAEIKEKDAEVKARDAELRFVREDLASSIKTAKDEISKLYQTVNNFLSTYSSIEFCKSCGIKFGGIMVQCQRGWGTILDICCACANCGKQQ